MKVFSLFSVCLILMAIAFPFGAGAAPAYDGGTTFSEVEGREWILSEVRTAGRTIPMDRVKLEADGLGGVYTITFQAAGQVNGMGAPNRYFGPYSVGANRALTLGNVAHTLMIAFREPDGLKEFEYFTYLSRVVRWDIRGGKLELYSSDDKGTEGILVFDRL